MYVILTSKTGEFRTEAGEGLQPVEAWNYSFCGRQRALFVIARLERPARIRIVDETPPPVVNTVPTKFLEKFDSLESARHELEDLARRGGRQASLEKAAT